MSDRGNHDDTRRSGERATVNRRGYLKAVGIATISAGSITGTGLASAASGRFTTAERDGYTEVTVESGGLWRTELTSGETLENVLVDVSAPGANAMIKPRGSGWTVRNVGFAGTVTGGWPHKRIFPRVDAGGTGTIENVYLGDGSDSGRQGGIFVMRDHAGHLDIKGVNVQGWADNGIYASAPGKSNGSGGTVAIADCFAKNNNTASYRIGTHGSSIRNSVVHIDGSIPAKRGASSGRAIWAWADESGNSGGPYEIDGVDIAIEPSSGGTWAVGAYPQSIGGTLARVTDSRVKGGVGLANAVAATDLGTDPDVTPPEAVPTSAEAAARGLSGGSGSADATTTATTATAETTATNATTEN